MVVLPDRIVTFGIDPGGPETGYGYLELSEASADFAAVPQKLKSFVEKPNSAKAAAMIQVTCTTRSGLMPEAARLAMVWAIESGGTAIGRGFAYGLRGDTVVAEVCEVEVDRETGRVWPRRFWVAHDCGLIINPRGLTQCIEGNIIHSTSRALFEETKFDERNVTSIDWISYPILDITDAPESIETVLINRTDLPPAGAGEPSSRPTAAAIANAVFDATGVRLRRVPFTRAYVKAALTHV